MTSVEEILKKRNIEPKQSHFLITHQSKSGKEDFFDPKDQYGLKLSSDWQYPTRNSALPRTATGLWGSAN